MKKLTILTIAYFFIPLATVFAHGGEETTTSVFESSWIGPLAAALIIIGAVVLAKTIKKK